MDTFAHSGKQKIPIQFNEHGIPVGHNKLFSSCMGDLVRLYVGLKYTTWKEVPEQVKTNLWDQITVQLDLVCSVGCKPSPTFVEIKSKC